MLIGITGGIGSGKSTVLEYLKQLNLNTLSCDKIARKLTRKNGKAIPEIQKEFKCVNNGVLDRKKLASIIFNDEERREKLNEIMHPMIYEEILKKSLKKTYYVEIPLLYETHFERQCDEVWLCVASKKTKIDRLIKRDKLSKEEINRRMRAQYLDRQRISKKPTHIINTDCEIKEIEKQINKILK